MRTRRKYIVSGTSTFNGTRPDGAPFDFGKQQYGALGVCSSLKRARMKIETLVKDLSEKTPGQDDKVEVRTEGDSTTVTMKSPAYNLEYTFNIKRMEEDA